MNKIFLPSYRRPQGETLLNRLAEPRRLIQFIGGPRQVGKTTLVRQVAAELSRPTTYASADEPALRGNEWLHQQWESARMTATDSKGQGAVLIVDEIQKVVGWSETVKRLWEEDSRSGTNLHLVLLGSAPLLMHDGLTESLMGRFETIHLGHWSLGEMADAFGWELERYLFFGGYPGAAHLTGDLARWRSYLLNAMIETTIARDVLLMRRIEKPALLRRLFDLGCRYSAQELSYTKMLGQLQDTGNTTTLAHYLELLSAAGMLTGLQKFSGSEVRKRASSPKLQVLNTGLMTAQLGITPEDIVHDRDLRGRVVESAVGAHLANAAAADECELYWWRDGDKEVDFVVQSGRETVAIEVKSGRHVGRLSGMAAFRTRFTPTRTLLVGGDGIPLEEFLRAPVSRWFRK